MILPKSTAARALVVSTGAVAFHAAPSLAVRTPVRRHLRALSGRGGRGTVAITFDDGPDPDFTPGVLKVLDRLRWPATFFMLGERAEAHPELVRDVVDLGHEVALHGYTHAPLLRLSPARTFRELRRGAEELAGITGRWPRWYRPTYGALSGSAVVASRRMGMRSVLWTSAAEDWKVGSDAERMRRAVLSSLGSGGTVLFHDAIQGQSGLTDSNAHEAALELLYEDLQRQQLRVVPLDAHLSW